MPIRIAEGTGKCRVEGYGNPEFPKFDTSGSVPLGEQAFSSRQTLGSCLFINHNYPVRKNKGKGGRSYSLYSQSMSHTGWRDNKWKGASGKPDRDGQQGRTQTLQKVT